MAMMDFMWNPFAFAGAGIMMIFFVLAFIFWIWMIIDCARRSFRHDIEKIVWIVVIVLATWVGALVYFLVIKKINPSGLIRKR